MSSEELYRVVRNQIRRLGFRESVGIIWAYSRYLETPDFELPAGIHAHDAFLQEENPQVMLPTWRFEQFTREVIRYADIDSRERESLRNWETLRSIVQNLSDLENELYGELAEGQIHLELMRIAHRQFIWQQHRLHWRWVIRYYKLLNTPEISRQSIDAIGLSIEEVFLVGMALLSCFFENPRIEAVPNIELPRINQDILNRFLSFTCRTRSQLADKLRAEHSLDNSYAYRYSSLRAFPLIKLSYLGIDEILCPIPTLLFWRFTSGLYYELKDQRGFATAFGASFQRYVGEVVQDLVSSREMTVLPEAEYYVGGNRKDTVDWLLVQRNEAAIFLECKTKRMTWASKAGLTDLSALEQDVRKLAGAIVQVYRTIRDYKNGFYPHIEFIADRQIYPVIVTLEDWYFFGFDLPNRLSIEVTEALERANLPLTWPEEMPYSILSIDDLDRFVGVINSTGIHEFMSQKIGDVGFRRWAYGTYCSAHYPEIVGRLPKLFRNEYEAMFENFANQPALDQS